jgi:hypothetical protein
VECFLCSVWALLGYAPLSQGGPSELVDGGSYEKRCRLEDGPSLYFVVHLGERNNRCFEDSPRTREELLHFFLVTLFSWTTGWLAPRVISFVDFLSLFSLSP